MPKTIPTLRQAHAQTTQPAWQCSGERCHFLEHRGDKPPRDMQCHGVGPDGPHGSINVASFWYDPATGEGYADARFAALAHQEWPGLLNRIEQLREALGWFLNDERFRVAVGGNPNVVDRMIAEAWERYGEDEE